MFSHTHNLIDASHVDMLADEVSESIVLLLSEHLGCLIVGCGTRSTIMAIWTQNRVDDGCSVQRALSAMRKN